MNEDIKILEDFKYLEDFEILNPKDHHEPLDPEMFKLSIFSDMLNDDERNFAYNEAILYTVDCLVKDYKQGQTIRCLDIGMGSGLLSMMVARAFKNLKFDDFIVYSVEQNKYIFETAKGIIKDNGFSSHIRPIHTDILNFTCKNENSKFDFIVAELLDTEAIGEGCLHIYSHAANKLAKPYCFYVPSKISIHVEPVSSLYLHSRSFPKPICINGDSIVDLKDIGSWSQLDDIHLDALKEGIDFHRITKSEIVFVIDIIRKEFVETECKIKQFTLLKQCSEPVVVCTWWTVKMYDKSLSLENPKHCLLGNSDFAFDTLSTMPKWAKTRQMLEREKELEKLYRRQVWRDHWLQAVYQFQSKEDGYRLMTIKEGLEFSVTCQRDDYSFIYALGETDSISRPFTNILVDHARMSLCYTDYYEKIYENLKKFYSTGDSQDNNIIYCYSKDKFPIIEQLCKALAKKGVIKITNNVKEYCRACVYDPYSHMQISDNIANVWLEGEVPDIKNTILPFFPNSVDLMCALVEFENLDRMYTLRDTVEGFSIEYMKGKIDDESQIDHYHLWEYDSYRLSSNYRLMTIDCTTRSEINSQICFDVPDARKSVEKNLFLALWSEYRLPTCTISTGPQNCKIGEQMIWDRHWAQGVYRIPAQLKETKIIAESRKDKSKISKYLVIHANLSGKGLKLKARLNIRA